MKRKSREFMRVSRTSRIRAVIPVGVGLGGILMVCLSSGGCFGGNSGKAENSGSSKSSRPISLIASGDTNGWIIPCGCNSNQSGGMLRRGSFIAAERKKSQVVLVDVGGAPSGSSPYDRVKFEAILKGELEMGIVAHNLGGRELKLGTDYLKKTARQLEIPFVSANVRDNSGNLVVPPSKLVKVSGKKLLIVGVLSPRFSVSGCRIGSPRDAVLAEVDRHKGKYDWLIVLAYLPEQELRKLASELPEADVVLGGPTHQSIRPTSVGPTVLSAATNKGKFLVHLTAPSESGKGRWSGEVIELGSVFEDDPPQKNNLATYYSELAKRDFAADQTEFVASLPVNPPAGYRIAGTESCLKCHTHDCKEWDISSHAHAWETLKETGSHVDSYCQQCHTSGFGMPGGFVSARRSQQRVNVGCESCHGPSLDHIRSVKKRTPFIARDQCVRCHDRENSPLFKYAEYWPQILHGQQPAKTIDSGKKTKTENMP